MDRGNDTVQIPGIALIAGAAISMILFAASSAAIVYIPVTKRIEGTLLILFAVIADSFLAAFIRAVGLLAKKFFHRPDIMADLFHKNYRFAGNLVSGLFVLPMIIAVIRILNLEE